MTIEDRLDRWAVYRRTANKINGSRINNPLHALYEEAAEVARKTRRVRAAAAAAKWRRHLLHAKLRAAKRVGDERVVMRLQRAIEHTPTTIGGLPWASMVHGVGTRQDDEDITEQEETNAAVLALPGHFREVIERQWLSDLSQQENARRMRLSRETYRRYLDAALRVLAYRLGA